MYSVATGKDWGTGRDLDATERGIRGVFAAIDIIPGVKYMSKLAKTGKVGGSIAIKATIKQSIKEGFQQGLKNIDSFKGFVKKLGVYKDNLFKQLDIKGSNALIFGAEKLKSGLSKFDNTISKAAQKFRLNMELEPQLVSGAFKSADSQVVSKITNKLDDFIKASKSHIDDVVGKSGKKVLSDVSEVAINSEKAALAKQRLKDFSNGNLNFEDVIDDYSEVYADVVNSNKPWSWTKDIQEGNKLTKGQRAAIKKNAFKKGLLPEVKVKPAEGMKYGFADFRSAGLVEETVKLPKDLWLKSDKEQFDWLNKQIGGIRDGMIWHHTEIPGKMELVPTGIHNIITHNGGRSAGLWAHAPR